jgi:hypothetical protein
LTDYGTRLIEDLTSIADAEAQRLAAEDSAAVMDRLQNPDHRGSDDH